MSNSSNKTENSNSNQQEKAHFIPPSIPRSDSILGTYLKTHTKHGTRKLYEPHSVPFQCEVVLGPPGKNRICWLCGFPIEHLSSLKDSDGKYIFKFDKYQGKENKMMDRSVCEHVLPVKLGHGILELLQLQQKKPGENPILDKLLHTEYEYAHNYCNFVKLHEYFVTLPLGSTDFCNLQIKEEIIDEVLRQIFHNQRGIKGSKGSSLVWTRHGRDPEDPPIFFKNIVQAYCYTMDTKAFKEEDGEKVYREVWFPRTKARIIDKINRVIQYVKEADNCSKNNNSRGAHFRGFQTRLEEGATPLTARSGLVSPGSIFTLKPEIQAKIAQLQRSPSYQSIYEATPPEERLTPFRSSSIVGSYAVNYNNNTSPASSPKRRASPKGKPVSNENRSSPVSTTSTTSSVEALFPNFRQLPETTVVNSNAAATNSEQEERANFVSELATTLAMDEARVAAKKNNSNLNLTTTNNSNSSNSNNSNASNENFEAFMLGEEAAPAPAVSAELTEEVAARPRPMLTRQRGKRNLLATNTTVSNRRPRRLAANSARQRLANMAASQIGDQRQSLMTSYLVRKPLPRINEKINLGKGLFATRKNNGYYMSGKTFPYKDKIKGLGASWVPNQKIWKVPLNKSVKNLKNITK